MYALEFQIDGEKALSRVLRITGEAISDMKPAMAQIGQVVRESAIDNIESQGSEGGGKWKPLSQRTVEMRRRGQGYYARSGVGGPTGPILVWTGRLKDGFRSTPEDKAVTIDNPVPYFKHHQAKERSGKLPRRLVLEMKAADKTKAMNIIAARIQDALEGGISGRQF